MSNTKKVVNPSKKKPIKPITKPYLVGKMGGKPMFVRARRVLMYTLISYVLYLLLGSVLSMDTVWLRVATNLILVAAMGALMYMDAISRGESDTAFGEILYKRKAEGHDIDEQDMYRSFNAKNGFVSALIGASPFILCAIIYAFLAEKQVYSLQVLPNWTQGYMRRAEIGGALEYYTQYASVSVVDILRIVVKMGVYPFISMVGANNAELVLLVDRLSPILMLILPAVYGIGYTRGKHARAIIHGSIAAGVKRAKRRDRKAREARKARQPEQLT